jgi:hypothetical protein
MSPKKPIIIDPTHPGATKAARDYAEGAKRRLEANRPSRASIPNLGTANELYKPGRDKPMTLNQMAAGQKAMEALPPDQRPKPGLRPETVAGLQALYAAAQETRSASATYTDEARDMQKATDAPQMAGFQALRTATTETRSNMTDQNMPTPPMPQMTAAPQPPQSTAPKTEPAAREPEAAAKDKQDRVKDIMSDMDEFEFDRVLRSIQHDAINNEEQRKAIKERVRPIDVIGGISTGEFVQDVPIIPGTLTVRYRTITALENQSIRLMLFKMIDLDRRRENISAELFGLMQTVCSIAMINNSALPPHLKGVGYDAEFDEDGFMLKFKTFLHYPLVLLHSLGTHGYWFEQRVREAFTTDNLKNG